MTLHVVLDGDTQPLPTAAVVGRWRVLARGSLYYRGDLRRRGGAGATDDDAATLVAHALERAGESAIDWLEGDCTFVAWDARAGALLAYRDFGGKHALYHAWERGRLVLSDDVPRMLAEPGIAHTLDLTTVATVAAGMWAHSDHTAYTAIRELQAGYLLRWRPGAAPTIQRHWQPPIESPDRRPLADAAAELRELLDAAVRERLDADGRTAVSLSGGWDSTAVYASARAIGGDALAVSISYPLGDPGREDETIEAVTRHWDSSPDFIAVDDIPLYGDWQAEAARRRLPFAHAYEHWNRALSRRAAQRGARVLLDGVGGDQLFQVSEIYLADLLRGGHLVDLAREVRARSGPNDRLRTLYRWAIRPNLPSGLADRIARLRGLPPPPNYLDRLPPPWFLRRFLLGHGVMERDHATRPATTASSHVLREAQAYFGLQFYPRVFALLSRFAAEEGITLRSPLMDERIVRFALRRPWSDRVRGAETKRSLRLAMRGRLPDAVLAPRPHRTGTTNGYMMREMRRAGWPVAEALLPDMRLVEIGMIEPTRYRRAWERILQYDDDELAARLFFTLQAELWLRTHLA
jgi:asparagine synthase (glutamine-hydrolysing)